MADGFHTKDIGKSYQICCQFLGEKITIRILLGFKVLNFLSSHIKPDDIPPEVKSDDVNDTEMRKANNCFKI